MGGKGVHEKSQLELPTRGTTAHQLCTPTRTACRPPAAGGVPGPAHAAGRCAPGEAWDSLVVAAVEKGVKLKVNLEKTIWPKASNGYHLIFTQFSSLGPWESRPVTEHSPEMSLRRDNVTRVTLSGFGERALRYTGVTLTVIEHLRCTGNGGKRSTSHHVIRCWAACTISASVYRGEHRGGGARYLPEATCAQEPEV